MLLTGEDEFSQFVPADGSIGSPLSTVGLVTSISDIINAWSGTDTCECFDLKLLRQLRRSHCQSEILTRPFPAQLKYLFQVEVMSYCFPTEYYFDQVRAPSHHYSQSTKSLVHLTHQWRYPDSQYGQSRSSSGRSRSVDNLGSAVGCVNGILLL